MKRFLDILAVVAIIAAVLFLLAVMMVGALFVPIDDGGEVSRLATAGIMRNADV
jgi:hypothetical protein